jgi:hypothetical protein
MIFAKIDVSFPRHYRLLEVRADSVRSALGIQLALPLGIRSEPDPVLRSESDRTHPDASERKLAEASARLARGAALGAWVAALCYTREQMLDGFCPLVAIREIATDETIDELVVQGLFARAEQDGRQGVVVTNYAKHNETKADIERRLTVDRTRKSSDRIPRGRTRRGQADSDRTSALRDDRIPPPESESESEPEGRKELPSQAPAPPKVRRERSLDHQVLIAHYTAEFERLKGVKPVIGARGGAGAKKLLEGRTLDEAKAIVDRALSDPWWLEKNPDLAAIAGKINSFIGRPPGGTPQAPVQPSGGAWKKAEVTR